MGHQKPGIVKEKDVDGRRFRQAEKVEASRGLGRVFIANEGHK